ncbi:MAG: hypothetical protein Kow00127_14670 [Bacteroidales bacterium]
MKKIFAWIILFLLVSCSSPDKSNESKSPEIFGDWAFLDRYGNYNEAQFKRDTFLIINRFVRQPRKVRYSLHGDSLWVAPGNSSDSLKPAARLSWIDHTHFVITDPFTSDTFERIREQDYTLSKIDPLADSMLYWPAFYKRYENFLIDRGIITSDEAEMFRKQHQIPEDIREKLH